MIFLESLEKTSLTIGKNGISILVAQKYGKNPGIFFKIFSLTNLNATITNHI